MAQTDSAPIDWLIETRRFGSKLGLKLVAELAHRMDDPQKKLRVIHVTGTNGKGSTTAMIASILRSAGYKVGMLTKPHLSRFTESVTINGEEMSTVDLAELIVRIKPHVKAMEEDPSLGHPTYWEIYTVIALQFFVEHSVDFAAIEVWMGGDQDATNIVNGLVSVITNVSLEHTQSLGNNVLEIATRKAGIIKQGGVLVTATQNPEVFALFEKICKAKRVPIIKIGKDIQVKRLSYDLNGQTFSLQGQKHKLVLFVPLLGEHQLVNSASAVGAIDALALQGFKIPETAISEGIRNVVWPGRLEIVQRHPLVILDGAKDPYGMEAMVKTIRNDIPHAKTISVVSISSDKDILSMIKHLASITDYFVVTAHTYFKRAVDPSLLVPEIQKYGKPYEIIVDVKDAIKQATALASPDDLVCVTGSMYLIGEARQVWFPQPVLQC